MPNITDLQFSTALTSNDIEAVEKILSEGVIDPSLAYSVRLNKMINSLHFTYHIGVPKAEIAKLLLQHGATFSDIKQSDMTLTSAKKSHDIFLNNLTAMIHRGLTKEGQPFAIYRPLLDVLYQYQILTQRTLDKIMLFAPKRCKEEVRQWLIDLSESEIEVL